MLLKGSHEFTMNMWVVFGTAVLLGASILGFNTHGAKDTLPGQINTPQQVEQTVTEGERVVDSGQKVSSVFYENREYGFRVSLPGSWRGYTVVTEEWEAYPVGDTVGDSLTGPLLRIRHPEWTAENPRQDIPIMIFTMAQWEALEADQYHIGAAPIGPRELARSQDYVLALPARYNFAFLTGYEEVETIVNNDSITMIQ